MTLCNCNLVNLYHTFVTYWLISSKGEELDFRDLRSWYQLPDYCLQGQKINSFKTKYFQKVPKWRNLCLINIKPQTRIMKRLQLSNYLLPNSEYISLKIKKIILLSWWFMFGTLKSVIKLSTELEYCTLHVL